jgi:hypothetical protein
MTAAGRTTTTNPVTATKTYTTADTNTNTTSNTSISGTVTRERMHGAATALAFAEREIHMQAETAIGHARAHSRRSGAAAPAHALTTTTAAAADTFAVRTSNSPYASTTTSTPADARFAPSHPAQQQLPKAPRLSPYPAPPLTRTNADRELQLMAETRDKELLKSKQEMEKRNLVLGELERSRAETAAATKREEQELAEIELLRVSLDMLKT